MKNSFMFTNFLGAITDSLTKEGYSPKQIRHLIVASLMEIVNEQIKEDGQLDHYALKPVYRFLINLYQEENEKMHADAYIPKIQEKMASNNYMISFLSHELELLERNLEE